MADGQPVGAMVEGRSPAKYERAMLGLMPWSRLNERGRQLRRPYFSLSPSSLPFETLMKCSLAQA
jgi:hypothetical protein